MRWGLGWVAGVVRRAWVVRKWGWREEDNWVSWVLMNSVAVMMFLRRRDKIFEIGFWTLGSVAWKKWVLAEGWGSESRACSMERPVSRMNWRRGKMLR